MLASFFFKDHLKRNDLNSKTVFANSVLNCSSTRIRTSPSLSQRATTSLQFVLNLCPEFSEAKSQSFFEVV